MTGRMDFDVINPATGEVVGTAPRCTPDDLDAAMAAAQRRFESWRHDASGRREAVLNIADALEKNAAELGRLITLEQGKPLAEGTAEVLGAAAVIRFSAGVDLPVEVIHDDENARVELRRRAIGPVVAITPWNGPLYMLAMKLGPALSAGNTVVAKPSPVTPLATARFAELIRDVLPDGAFAVLTDDGDLGQRMVAHPAARKVSFTGSVATGRKVATAAVADLKRVTLELGGNDPALVLPDVDIEHAVAGLATMAFNNAGQVCVAPKRIYVHESCYDEFVDALKAAAETVRVGNGLDDGVEMGPLTTPEQRAYVEELIADATGNGGRILAGGKRTGDVGNFLEPTVVIDVGDQARIVREEQFGPAVPVLRYRDVEDAVARANDTLYGLGASVWGSDRDELARVGPLLDAGQVWINTHRAVATPGQPVLGVKHSGLGAENGAIGVLDFTDAQMVFEAKSGAR
jgi:acyl-CoA reductase-like NAD-dependent aldehyde dehydrogenase